MLPENAFELRDPDGTYLVARPLGRGRCLVLLSNLYAEGDVLHMGDPVPWREAAADKGLGTRISPHDLHIPRDDEEAEPFDLDHRQDDEDVLRETHEVVCSRSRAEAARWTLRAQGEESVTPEADPAALALRLMIHYLVVHEKPRSATRRVEVCRCDRYAPRADPTLASIHAIVYSAVRHRKGPGLARIQAAIARAARALKKKEESQSRPALAA